MKASNRSPPGRPNPPSAKAEVNKVAGRGKDKTETRQVQDKTQDSTDGKDRTMDVKQVQNKTTDGARTNMNTTEAGQVQDRTQTRQVQDSVTEGVPKPKDATELKYQVVNAEEIPDMQKKDSVQGRNKVTGEAETEDRVLNSAEVKNQDAMKKTDETTAGVNDKVSIGGGLINEQHRDGKGLVNDSVGGAEGIKLADGKTNNEGQVKMKENHLEQKSITKTLGKMNDDKTSEQRKEKDRETNDHERDREIGDQKKGRETGDEANGPKKSSLETHSEAAEQAKKVTIIVQDEDSSDQTKPTNSDHPQRPANQTEKTKAATPSIKVKENEDEKENKIGKQKDGNDMQNGNLDKNTDKVTRSRHKRNETRRTPDEEDEESDDYGDHLAMDNELVRHLLPHMSPALLPKSLQSQNKSQSRARDYSPNSSEDERHHPKKLSLNVIKESCESENGEENSEENSEEESDDELPALPPTSLPSLRRHSFHHFPAPPTESQSKNAEKVRALLQAVEEEELEKISKKLGEKTGLVRQHLGHVESRLFEMFGNEEKKTININKFLMGLTAAGMRPSDPRLKQTRDNLKSLQENLGSEFVSLEVDYETFMGIISENLEVVVKAFSAAFVIPDFQGFGKQIEDLYNRCYTNHSGKPAQYIPQLARFDSKSWGVSVCTVDGQRFSMGDVDVPFTIQSCSKPLTYAIGLAVNGTDYMHNYVGMEPSGRYFNELVLDYSNKPHNPMINSGAIMTAAIIKPELSAADRFDYMFKVYKRLAGDEYLGFNNSVFLSERECADRNFALAYFMRENKCFPANHKLQESLDFYFQLCSLEITAESGAVIAATLANGGLNPLTNDPVLTVDAVRNTLTLMHSCGMYNYSGQFAFHVGLPAKSGVSGCVLLVIPNTMGICLWSPPLDSNGNSCRGVQFCMEMVSRFNFHNFDNLRGYSKSKQDPRTTNTQSKAQILFDLLFSAAAGDMSAVRRHALAGTDMQGKDYDGRTALHVATSEGHDELVEFLLDNCHVDPLPKDRWDRTPLDDAESFDHGRCAQLITDCCRKKGIKLPMSYKTYMALTNKPNGPLQLVNGI